jgi:hypothetical protein
VAREFVQFGHRLRFPQFLPPHKPLYVDGAAVGVIEAKKTTKALAPKLTSPIYSNLMLSPPVSGQSVRLRPSSAYYWAGFSSGSPNGTGLPKRGLPSSFHVNRWVRGERKFPHPSPRAGLA